MLIEQKKFQENDGSVGYIESVFKSDNILKTTYFPLNQRLYIAFNRGETYSYGNISNEMYEEFENAESQGVFFNKNIKKNDTYPFRKEFTLYPNEVKDLKQIVEDHKIEEDDE